ncbi:MAG: hypothetical protein EP329_20700 [Deltaproteobacteria bacterium]|nr:MAG: hypothetical protein EP329_20700 [Deltaproteobacteria bacterium]
MKQWTRTLLVGLAGLSLVFAACGDDGNSTETDTTTTDTVTTDTGGEDTTQTAVTDQCIGTDDLARITDTTQPDPTDLAGACGTQVCLSLALQGDFAGAQACAETCMKDGNTDASLPPAGLSDGCTTCYVQAVLCAAQHCLSVCASDASAQPCIDCRAGGNDAGVNCTQNFYDCSGLTPQ